MQGGDISNIVSPRLLVVWEGLIGVLPDAKVKARADKALRRGKWADVVQPYVENRPATILLRDIWMRSSVGVDVVTYLPIACVPFIRDWSDDRNVLTANTYAYVDPETLARELAYMPHVVGVIDPDPARQLTYGSKGRCVDPSSLDPWV